MHGLQSSSRCFMKVWCYLYVCFWLLFKLESVLPLMDYNATPKLMGSRTCVNWCPPKLWVGIICIIECVLKVACSNTEARVDSPVGVTFLTFLFSSMHLVPFWEGQVDKQFTICMCRYFSVFSSMWSYPPHIPHHTCLILSACGNSGTGCPWIIHRTCWLK